MQGRLDAHRQAQVHAKAEVGAIGSAAHFFSRKPLVGVPSASNT